MVKRYGQIKKGLEYETALNNYVEYLRNPANRTTKRMTGGTRGERRDIIKGAVLPFGIDASAGQYYLVSVSVKSNTAIGASVSSRLFTSGTNLTGADKLSKFSPAKAQVFRGSGAASYQQSKVTKLWYLKYEGDSYSIPFGALTETEEEQTGARLVRSALLSGGSASDVNRVSIVSERVPV